MHKTDTHSSTIYDFIIVGSGVSGGRIAFELCKTGAKCLLLEAGREFSPKTFPSSEIDYSAQLFWGGGIEFNTSASLGFLRAKCLGGTSIVNQALLDRFDDLAWDDWKDWSGIDFFSKSGLEKHYDHCEAELAVQSIPEDLYSKNAKLFIEGFNKQKLGWKPLRRAQSNCALEKGSDCIVCLGGCPRNSKQSSLVTSILKGRDCGLDVLTETFVDTIEEHQHEVRVLARQNGEPLFLRAKDVFLAAGSFGNTAILLRSDYKQRNPGLGTRFTCHPQFMNYGVYNETIDAHKGAFQSVKSSDPYIRKAGFKFENVFTPPISTGFLIPGIGAAHQRLMLKYRHLSSIEVAVRDEPTGKMFLGRGGKFQVEKKLTDQDRSRAKAGLELMEKIFESNGAKEIIRCKQGFGLHLMGGCPIGLDSSKAVVDPEFRLHGSKHIWISDSSIFPSAPGINPSFTIMALSHRAAQNALRSRGALTQTSSMAPKSSEHVFSPSEPGAYL